MGSVYLIVDPRDPNVCYVGETEKSLSGRLFQHMADAFEARSVIRNEPKRKWLREIWEAGLMPEISYLEFDVNDRATRLILETQHIVRLRAGGKTVMNANLSALATERQANPVIVEMHRKTQTIVQNRAEVSAKKSASMKAYWERKRAAK